MQSRITKEELEALPKVDFSGNIVVINNFEESKHAVQEIRNAHTFIGFDTETRPAFVKGVVYKVSLIQLSVGSTAYLFRLNKMRGIGDDLKALLQDPDCIKVGLSTPDDFHNLRKWDEDLVPRGVIEIQDHVKKFGIEEMSLAKVYGVLFGKKISKRQRLTNWDADILTDKQLQYAALDAVACVEIYNALLTMGQKIIQQ